MFEGLIGNRGLLDVLAKTAAKPPHGLLFAGPEGVGKRLAAEAYAAGLLGCAVTELNAHPDFVRAEREEEKKEFTIKKARELMERMRLSSARGGFVVALVDEAERLNIESANALLKAVEEPGPHTVYLFVTQAPERLPATLRSRLVAWRFEPVAVAELVPWLVARGIPLADAAFAAEAGAGSPARALAILENRAAYTAAVKTTEAWLGAVAQGPLGKAVWQLDVLARRVEKSDDAEGEWRAELRRGMRLSRALAGNDPGAFVRAGEGLLFAWRQVGSAVSPRLPLEAAALSPYLKGEPSLTSFFHPRYL
jgi:DNA polymerase-3 subunit delta'